MKKQIVLLVCCILMNSAYSQWNMLNNDYLPARAVTAYDSVIIISGQTTDQMYHMGYSTDFGETWHGTNVAPGINVNYLYHVDDMVYACAANGIYKSGKADLNWISYSEGLPGGVMKKIVVNGNVLLAIDNTSLYKRVIGDTTWVTITEISPVSIISDFDFDGNLIVLAGYNGIAESYDMGETWSVWTGYAFLWDAVFINGDTIIAASPGGVRRKLLSSSNIVNVNNGLALLWSPHGDYYGDFYTFHKAGEHIFLGGQTALYKLVTNIWFWLDVGSGAYGLADNGESLFAARNYSGIWQSMIEHLTGIQDNTTPVAHSLTIYPVPAEKTITIETSFSTSESKTLSVFNLNGQLVYESKLTDALVVIDVEKWPKGLYFVSLASNNQIETGRFVKQ